jgi:hypothetical protein
MHATSQTVAQEDALSRETANNTENALFHRMISMVPRFELGRTSLGHSCIRVLLEALVEWVEFDR